MKILLIIAVVLVIFGVIVILSGAKAAGVADERYESIAKKMIKRQMEDKESQK